MISIPSRVKRHTKKVAAGTGLNLISLMDILTTLVFFLLIHVTNDVEVVQVPGNVRLPASISTAKPSPAITVYITTHEILVDDKTVERLQNIPDAGISSIDALENELLMRAKQDKSAPGTENKADKRITIMGDREIPFTLLKKVMNTCSKAGYSTITLAVLQKDIL